MTSLLQDVVAVLGVKWWAADRMAHRAGFEVHAVPPLTDTVLVTYWPACEWTPVVARDAVTWLQHYRAVLEGNPRWDVRWCENAEVPALSVTERYEGNRYLDKAPSLAKLDTTAHYLHDYSLSEGGPN